MAEDQKTEWVLIGKDEPLSPGDTVKLYFTVIGPTWVAAAQIAAAEKELEKDTRFRVLSHSLPEGGGLITEMWWKVRVNQQPTFGGGGGGQPGGGGAGGEWFTTSLAPSATLITVAIIAGVIAAATRWIWLTFREARKMVVEGGPEVLKAMGTSFAKIAAAAVIGLVVVKWFLGKT